MKSFEIQLVTEHQNKPEKANKLGELLAENLGMEFIVAKRYSKFDSSFRIHLQAEFPEDKNPFEYCLLVTGSIANDWQINYDAEFGRIEMILNKSPYTRFKEQAYNVIIWAQFSGQ